MTKISGQILLKILSYVRNRTPYRNYSLLVRKSKDKTTNNKFSPYIILKANKDDQQEVLKIMHDVYYNDEPTLYCLGIQPNALMDEIVMQKMAEGVTIVAKCKYDGCIVGAAVNESTNPWDPSLKEKLACNVQCPKMKHWLLFQAFLQRHPKLWDCYNVQKVFEICHVFAKQQVNGREFIKRLVEESRTLGADCGYTVVRLNATTQPMANICDSLNMKMMSEIPYCSYLGRDNMEPLFNPAYPNESVKIFIDENPQKNSTVDLAKKTK